jgi:hypothetical protein
MFTTISMYLKAHEKLILAGVAGLVLWFGIGKIDTLIQHHDAAALVAAQATLQAQQSKDAALATQATAQAQQYAALAAKVDAQNAALVNANATLSAALAKQQKTDAGLPPTELANRWLTLVPESKPTVITGGIMVPESGAVATVQNLEQVPVLRTQLENERTQLGNTQALLTASTGQTTTLNQEISGLKLEAVDQTKVCTAQVAEVKAAAAKSKRRWFLTGLVLGFLGRSLMVK